MPAAGDVYPAPPRNAPRSKPTMRLLPHRAFARHPCFPGFHLLLRGERSTPGAPGRASSARAGAWLDSTTLRGFAVFALLVVVVMTMLAIILCAALSIAGLAFQQGDVVDIFRQVAPILIS